MSDTATHEVLIGELSGELRPVRRLPAPWKRTALWVGAVLLFAVPLSYQADFPALAVRLGSVPDMWLSQAGAALTAILAAWAAFQTSVPGRPIRLAWLPVLPALLWVGASTAGCLRLTPIPATETEPPMHPMACMRFLLLVSVPLVSLLTWALMRACPLRPGLTAALAGLASAGAASCLLTLIHPFDATADDLLMHLLAVLLVVGITRAASTRMLDRERNSTKAGK
jgi:hypothetical protein